MISDYKKHSDQALLNFLKKNNQRAFTEIYDRYKEVLHRYAYQWLQDRDAVKDVIQELFIIIWTKRDTITFSQNFSGYLYTALRNAVLRKIQQEDRKNKYANSLQEYADRGVEVTDHLLREKQLRSLIAQEVSLLPPKMREIFELSRNEYFSHADIAEKLGLSEQTIRVHIKKALKILRGKLVITLLICFLLHQI